MRSQAIRLSTSRRTGALRRNGPQPRVWLTGGVLSIALGLGVFVQPTLRGAGEPPAAGDVQSPPQLALAFASPSPISRSVAETAVATPVPTHTPAAQLPLGLERLLPTPPTPTPTVGPPPPANEGLLTDLRGDIESRWLRNHRETDLHGGPEAESTRFTTLPQFTLLREMERRDEWTLVYYSGDGEARQPGPGWVRLADVGPVGTPTQWLAAARTGAPLWREASGNAAQPFSLPQGTLMEVMGTDAVQGTRIRVRLPGDGRGVPPGEGWIESGDAARQEAPGLAKLPWLYPSIVGQSAYRLGVPYVTQLDGSPYAAANCGPTSLAMVFEMFGINTALRNVRAQVLSAMDIEWNDDAGSFVWALARVAEDNGLKVHGLYEGDPSQHQRWTLADAYKAAGEPYEDPANGSRLRQWTTDEVRAQVELGRPVILQVRYRALPRRGDSDYYGDHYIVVAGMLGDAFLYHDPIGGTSAREGAGWERTMNAEQLERAMNASDGPYAYTGFSLYR